MGKLDRKVAIVTGASRGIGKEIAKLYAAEGARVVCTARTLTEGTHPLEGSLETTVAEIRAAGGEASAVVCDVSEYDNCARAVTEARGLYGPIDVLVNNAALTYFIPVAEFPVAKWLRSTAVNFHGPFFLSQLVLADMIPRRRGSIVNVSSGAAIGPGRGPYADPPQRGGTLYGAEKAALERFTQGLASEVYQHGISVTCFSPSQVVATPGVLHHRLVKDKDDPRAEPPEMMARAALLLATEPLDRVTGRVTYDQEILKEFGWIQTGRGIGFERKGSGYSLI
jgi:NAD(P)-dependent dehydrogenase (short-subunit alcohol dehydrogenase family)